MTCSDTVSPIMSMMCSSPEFSLTTSSDVSLQLRHVNPNLQRYESNQKNRSTCLLVSKLVLSLLPKSGLLGGVPLLPTAPAAAPSSSPPPGAPPVPTLDNITMYALTNAERTGSLKRRDRSTKDQFGWNLEMDTLLDGTFSFLYKSKVLREDNEVMLFCTGVHRWS